MKNHQRLALDNAWLPGEIEKKKRMEINNKK
jgi:hypothetical protein